MALQFAMAAGCERSPLISAVLYCWCICSARGHFDLPVHEEALRWARCSASEAGRRGAPSVVRGPQDSAHLIGVATDIMWRDLALIPRTTMFLEVFSGASETTALCASTWGMAAYSIEKLRGPAQDVCTAEGLLYAIYLLASLIAGSLCHMSPQCSTWLDMCRHHTCRSREDTEGNLGRKDVAEANH